MHDCQGLRLAEAANRLTACLHTMNAQPNSGNRVEGLCQRMYKWLKSEIKLIFSKTALQ